MHIVLIRMIVVSTEVLFAGRTHTGSADSIEIHVLSIALSLTVIPVSFSVEPANWVVLLVHTSTLLSLAFSTIRNFLSRTQSLAFTDISFSGDPANRRVVSLTIAVLTALSVSELALLAESVLLSSESIASDVASVEVGVAVGGAGWLTAPDVASVASDCSEELVGRGHQGEKQD